MSLQTGSGMPPTMQRKLRILVVDDSAVIRTVISKTLQAEADMEVAGVAFNGEMAIKNVKALDPDIVILDIEMPVMDGLTALPLMLKEKPGLRVIVCSTLSSRGADVSVRALEAGATDYILKPGGEVIASADQFQSNLVRMLRSIGSGIAKRSTAPRQEVILRKPSIVIPPRILAIGSSTGGPKILMEVLTKLKGLPVPIVITQHMPKAFTTILAQHITQNCDIPAVEGKEGDVLHPGHAYVAPGGFHMTFRKIGDNATIHLTEDPPENYCRPSVNPMLRGLIKIYGGAILTVILTGMGNDGSQACADVVKSGGRVIAQDEATSVVWGMPGAVATAGVCSAVLPAGEIGDWIRREIK